MTRRRLLACFAVMNFVVRAHGGHIVGGVNWNNTVTTQFNSAAYATYYDGSNQPTSATLSGSHKVSDWFTTFTFDPFPEAFRRDATAPQSLR